MAKSACLTNQAALSATGPHPKFSRGGFAGHPTSPARRAGRRHGRAAAVHAPSFDYAPFWQRVASSRGRGVDLHRPLIFDPNVGFRSTRTVATEKRQRQTTFGIDIGSTLAEKMDPFHAAVNSA